MLAAVVAHEVVVTLQVVEQLEQPRLTLVVSRDGGFDAEGVHVAHLVDVDGAVDAAAHVGVVGHDGGDLQACHVERLGGREACHRPVAHCLAHRGIGRVGVSRHHELAVDFVGDDGHAVAQADVAQAGQFVARPHAACGVVGVAEQHDLHARVGRTAFQVVEVHAVGLVFIDEGTFLHRASVVADGGEETVVHGRLHQHLVARCGERLDDGREGGHHA